jgi:hypothetical protein
VRVHIIHTTFSGKRRQPASINGALSYAWKR